MIEIIYEDDKVLAVNKQPGIVVFPGKDSLAEKLSLLYPPLNNVGGERKGAVHRLDKDTSGVVLFAKDEESLVFLQKQLLEQKAKKKYIALVFKKIKKDEGVIDLPIDRSPKNRKKQRAGKGKREAVTFFRTLKRFKEYSLLEVFPKSGRKHQIRCHLAHIGHPVVGDKLYRFKDQKDPVGLERTFLHAEEIDIKTPSGRMSFRAGLPEDLKKIINKLEEDVS